MKSSLIARMKKKCYKNYNAALRSLAKASDSSLVVLFQVGISRNAFVGLRPKSANGQPGGVVCKFGLPTRHHVASMDGGMAHRAEQTETQNQVEIRFMRRGGETNVPNCAALTRRLGEPTRVNPRRRLVSKIRQ